MISSIATGCARAWPRLGSVGTTVAESFWSTLKEELIHLHAWPTRAMARQAIFEFIEIFYNHQRLHSSLDYQSPAEYEARGSGQTEVVDAA